MIRRNIAALLYTITGIKGTDHVLVEIISDKKKDKRSRSVLHVYSSPSKSHRFATLFKKTMAIVKGQALIITWGRTRETKGRHNKITGWDKFRELSEEIELEEPVMDIKAWTEAVKKKMAEATRVVPEEAGLETVDSRLLHL
ncbi:hypothetical protein HPB47_018253 [Ixodes persulcatus]|uniref:Uncharacterized protein n=1 Tax=Ixodes persulcatus TaxID=34615 RepID=A0AC60QL88_IXOPE|nr:hypothetical protein HPB47_018253 [Ixodes persulcatus]